MMISHSKFVLSLAILCIASMSASAQSLPVSFGIERGSGKVICTDDADINESAAIDSSYYAAALWDRMYLNKRVCGPELESLDGGTWGESVAFSATDESGRPASFRLYVLHEKYVWTSGSSKRIEENGRFVQFRNVLTTPQFFERFCRAKAVLSLGTASHDGPAAINHRLSGNRAAIVSTALKAARGKCDEGQIPLLYAVNLGEHEEIPDGQLSSQRRLIIVAVEELAIGVDVRQALYKALADQSVLSSFDIKKYDLFVVDQT